MPAIACSRASRDRAESGTSRRMAFRVARRPFTAALVIAAVVSGAGLGTAVGPARAATWRSATNVSGTTAPAGPASSRLVSTAHDTTDALASLARGLAVDPGRAGHDAVAVADLSRSRQAALVALAKSDPEQVAQDLLPPAELDRLRGIPGNALEEPAEVSGILSVFHRDAPNGDDVFQPELVSSGGHVVDLYTNGVMPKVAPGSTVRMSGYQLDASTLFVWSSCSTCTTSYTAVASGLPTALGPLNVAVLLGNFANSSTPLSAAAEQAAFSGSPGSDVDSWYSAVSWGKSSLHPSVFGPFTLSESTGSGGSCPSNLSTAESDLMNQASAQLTFANYQRFMIVFDCTGYGASTSIGQSQLSTPQGTVTGAMSFFDATTGSQGYYLAHELAHNLGNYHAAFFACEPSSFVPPTRFGQNCASSEYGDEFDVLGATLQEPRAMPFLGPYHANNAGWFSASNWLTLSTPGTYTETLLPYETPSSGLQAIDIPRGNGTDFTLDYRQALSFDSFMAPSNTTYCQNECTITAGPMLELLDSQAGAGGGSDTQAIDTTPNSIQSPYYYDVPDERDGALLPGKTFTDHETGISITTDSASASGTTVTINVPAAASCTRGAPTISLLSPATQSTGSGQSLSYTLSVTDTSSSRCSAMEYKYFPDSPALGTTPSGVEANFTEVASPDVMTLSPGQTQDVAVTLTPGSTTTDGSYTFSLAHSHGIGILAANALAVPNTALPDVTFQLTSPPDSSAPTTPTGLSAQVLGSSTVDFTWAASTDDTSVAGYRVLVDGAYLYDTTSASFLDYTLNAGASHSLSVQAFDPQGNLSPASTITVALPSKTDTTAPSVPGVPTASATDRTITVSWVPSTDDLAVVGYLVLPFDTFVPAPATSTTFSHLPTDTTYAVQVVAYDGSANASSYFMSSAPSVAVTTAFAGTVAPTQPTSLWSPQATVAGGIQLSWSPSADPAGVTGYSVLRNGRPWATVGTTSYTDPPSDLYPNGAGYQYSVEAYDAAGNVSPPSPVLQTISPNQASTDSVPPTGASLTSPATGATVLGTVTLSTSPTDNVGVQKVEFYVDGVSMTTVYPPTSGPFTYSWDTTTTWNGTHVVYARAYDAAGNYSTASLTSVTVSNPGSGTSSTTSSALSDTTPPTAPTNLGATAASPTQIDLSWGASTDDVGVAGYRVFRGSTQVASVSGSSTTYADASVAAGTTYTYTVEAYDAAGNVSAPSNSATTATPALTGSVAGTVEKTGGGGLGGVKVTVSSGTSAYATTTSSSGSFSVGGLGLGNWTVTCQLKGYKTATVTVSVAAGSTSTLTVTMVKSK